VAFYGAIKQMPHIGGDARKSAGIGQIVEGHGRLPLAGRI
jgi:hypothetical protein